MSGQQASVFLSRVQEALEKYEERMRLNEYPILNHAHEATKQPRIYILLAAVAVAALVLIQLLGLSFISNLFAFIPIYASFKALRSPEKEDDELWLTYWVVYGSLGLFESFFDTVLFWMPLYYFAKIALLIWAFHPNTRGAGVIYRTLLAPLFNLAQSELAEIREQARAAAAARKRVQ